jgi:hypothetical protein
MQYIRLILILSTLSGALGLTAKQKQENIISQEPNTKYVSDPNIDNLNIPLFDTGFLAQDIGVGSEGDVYAIDLYGKLNFYDFAQAQFLPVQGDIELPPLSRVDVDSEGTPYVVTSEGTTYYLDCNNQWILLPGCGTEIGVGRNGDVWKVGCDGRKGGYGIWKLFCKSTCKCNCGRRCTRFRSYTYNPAVSSQNYYPNTKTCYWYRVEGGAQRLDVNPEGHPWVLTDKGDVYAYDGINWHHYDGMVGHDIAISNDGLKYVTSPTNEIYVLLDQRVNEWTLLSQRGKEISAGPFNQPWTIGVNNRVYTWSKQGFN